MTSRSLAYTFLTQAFYSELRPIASSSLFALSPAPENKLLHHEPIGAKPRKKRLNLPGKIFDPKWGEEEIEMRNDLIDCGIDVCSVDVRPRSCFHTLTWRGPSLASPILT